MLCSSQSATGSLNARTDFAVVKVKQEIIDLNEMYALLSNSNVNSVQNITIILHICSDHLHYQRHLHQIHHNPTQMQIQKDLLLA